WYWQRSCYRTDSSSVAVTSVCAIIISKTIRNLLGCLRQSLSSVVLALRPVIGGLGRRLDREECFSAAFVVLICGMRDRARCVFNESRRPPIVQWLSIATYLLFAYFRAIPTLS